MGILLALAALFSWGLGDFLIQKSARKFGNWIALFYITAFGSIVLFPFTYAEISPSLTGHFAILLLASFVILFAGLLDFEALRIGKISVIEPIYALEIPVAALLAALLIRESISAPQWILIICVVIGIILTSTTSFRSLKKIKGEKGVWQAFFATIGMGVVNFLFGIGSRETSPLMINWFTDIFIAVIAFGYLAFHSRLGELIDDLKNEKALIFNVSFFDNLAWITFSYAMLFIPIAIATGISEGYIAFAGLLGLVFNKEKLKARQWAGFFLVVMAVIVLALITDK